MPSPAIGLPRTPGAEPGCLRTGRCCERVTVRGSPRQFRDDFAKFQAGEEPRYHEIDKLAPMLDGICLGAIDHPATDEDHPGFTTYVYGPCPNLRHEIIDQRRIASCAIQETKPHMCSAYPWYENPPEKNAEWLRRACGYAPPGTKGRSVSEYLGVRALREDEK